MASRLDIAVQALHRRADTVECWDDDPDFAELDQIQHPPATATTPTTTTAPARAGADYYRREPSSAVSSRRSTITSAYDLDALEVADREHQIPFDGSPAAAIKSAQSAGIPIPENVPLSALVGGTIKRLGPSTRARKVTMHDDWGEDLEFPSMGDAFTVKTKEFPQSLHHMPSKGKGIRNISPSRVNLLPVTNASEQLNKFRDMPEDEMFFGECEQLPSLKAFAAGRTPMQGRGANMSLPTPPLSESAFRPSPTFADDDFDADFEFPADAPLQLGGLRGMERSRPIDFHAIDMGFEDWGDGDSGLGSSYAGTRGGADHGAHSVVSPSISAMTMESEDDMYGLELPGGMLPDFHRALERRRRAAAAEESDLAPAPINHHFHAQKDFDDPASEEEFFEGIEIGDVFDSKKLSLNGNVRQKQQPRKPSPIRRTAMSLTFTTKPLTPQSSAGRLNRLTQGHPTLLPSAPLEPVAERENQPSTVKRIPRNNRWGSADYRWNSSEQTPPPPPIPRTDRTRTLATDGRRPLSTKSTRNLRGDNAPPPTTTHAQLLRAKRSMPNIQDSPNSQKGSRPQSRASNGRPPSRSSSGRPPSSGNASTRPTSSGTRPPPPPPPSSATRPTSTGTRPTNNGSRPTSTGARPPNANVRPPSRSSNGRPPSRNDRTKTANAPAARHPAPFMCGGSSTKSSHHVAAKTSNKSLDSRGEGSTTDRRPNSRLQNRNITPRHSPSSSGASNTTAKRITPAIAPEQLRREAATIGTLTQPTRKRNFGDGTELETFDDLPTNAKVENTFTKAPAARGVVKARPKSIPTREAESPRKKKQQHETTPRQDDVPRFARDTTASRKAREITQQRLGMGTPVPQTPNADRWRSKIAARSQAPSRVLPKKTLQHKPHLIKPMGNITTLPKENAANGMVYNPRTFRWEGNDKDLRAFEVPDSRTPPRPALITKVNQSGSKMGIQVVGGMVFDPSRMCWLKVDEDPDDEDDPFEGLDDLPEDIMSVDGQSVAGAQTTSNSVVMSGVGGAFGGAARISGGFGEFVVGEEFDVGPEFVRRQREEEDRWRKTTDGWIQPSADLTTRENRYYWRELLAESR